MKIPQILTLIRILYYRCRILFIAQALYARHLSSVLLGRKYRAHHSYLADIIEGDITIVDIQTKKKAIYPRQPIFFVNLKSNTMKNTLQRYGLSAYLQIFKAK